MPTAIRRKQYVRVMIQNKLCMKKKWIHYYNNSYGFYFIEQFICFQFFFVITRRIPLYDLGLGSCVDTRDTPSCCGVRGKA